MGRAGFGKLQELTSNLFSLQGILDVCVEMLRGLWSEDGKVGIDFSFSGREYLELYFLTGRQ